MISAITSREPMTLAELYELFGPLPAHRLCTNPPPGLATEADWQRTHDDNDRLYELVDGVLLEKDMGYFEGRIAAVLIHLLEVYLESRDLGFVVGADGASRFLPGLIRIPDVSFVAWTQLPNRAVPRDPLPDLVPDLVVEILSRGNTDREMDRKLRDYFSSGVRLVWYIDPRINVIDVFESVANVRRLDADAVLDGGAVLPGFAISVRELFTRAARGTAAE